MQRISDCRRDTNFTAESRAHPQHVVIAPLNVDFFGIVHQQIKNRVGSVAAVKEITDKVQAMNRQPLNQRGQCVNKIFAALNLDD